MGYLIDYKGLLNSIQDEQDKPDTSDLLINPSINSTYAFGLQ